MLCYGYWIQWRTHFWATLERLGPRTLPTSAISLNMRMYKQLLHYIHINHWQRLHSTVETPPVVNNEKPHQLKQNKKKDDTIKHSYICAKMPILAQFKTTIFVFALCFKNKSFLHQITALTIATNSKRNFFVFIATYFTFEPASFFLLKKKQKKRKENHHRIKKVKFTYYNNNYTNHSHKTILFVIIYT